MSGASGEEVERIGRSLAVRISRETDPITLSSLQRQLEAMEGRRKAMEIQYGNHIAYLDAQTKLVEQQNERIVQQRKLVEIAAARQALAQDRRFDGIGPYDEKAIGQAAWYKVARSA